MESKTKMDPTDKKILEILKEDGRKSYREIADMIGKTEATVRRRVAHMTAEKLIKKFTVVLNNSYEGSKTKATVKIKPDIKKIREISDALAKIDEVTDIWRLSGDCGILIFVEIPNMGDLDTLIEQKISQIEGVHIAETCFITKEIKNNYN